MKKYIIDTHNKKDYTAGSKARDDIDAVLVKCGFEKRAIYIGDNKKKVFQEVYRISKQLKIFFSAIEEGSFVAVQYPWPTMSYSFAKIINNFKRCKSLKIVVIIHDLNSLRTGSFLTRKYYENYVNEIKYLDQFDKIICHNDCMKKYLINRGILADKIIPLEIFDYLTAYSMNSGEQILKADDFKSIIVAGNLSIEKTKYLYSLSDLDIKAYHFDLYGPFYTGIDSKSVQYKGKYPAEELPLHLKEGFGLVWDGESLNTCSGHYGEYMKINNPHKLSLYMACNIPVFIWKDAAAAIFVKENRVGFCIESLNEINLIMDKLTLEKYQKLLANVSVVHRKVLRGEYIKTAVSKAFFDLTGDDC